MLISLFLQLAVIQDIVGAKKKPNATLTDVFGGMGLAATGIAEGGETSEAAAAVPSLPQRKRYRKLATMTAAEMMQAGSEKLQQLLASGPSSEPTKQGNFHTTASNGASRGSPSAAAAPSLSSKPAGARYEQIRRRRGLTNFEITESLPDPLRDLGSLYDVVRMDIDEVSNTPGVNEAQGALICNLLPMVREYLAEEEGTKKRKEENGNGHGAASFAHTTTQSDASLDPSTSVRTSDRTAQIEASDDVEIGDGYVYDLYIEAGTGDNAEEEERWWDLHARGGAPVVQILDDDTWLVVEGSDVDDSDADSEDSNAEGYYGNDYPDEGAWNEDDSFTSGSDFGGGKGHTGRRKEWFDESDTDSDY